MRNETTVDPNKVKEEIEGLRHLTVGKLKDRYCEVFGEESRSNHKQFLFRRIAWRIQARSKSERAPEPLRLSHPLSSLPWDIAQDEFGIKGADFIGAMGEVVLRAAKNQFKGEVVDSARNPARLPPSPAKNQFQTQPVDSS